MGVDRDTGPHTPSRSVRLRLVAGTVVLAVSVLSLAAVGWFVLGGPSWIVWVAFGGSLVASLLRAFAYGRDGSRGWQILKRSRGGTADTFELGYADDKYGQYAMALTIEDAASWGYVPAGSLEGGSPDTTFVRATVAEDGPTGAQSGTAVVDERGARTMDFVKAGLRAGIVWAAILAYSIWRSSGAGIAAPAPVLGPHPITATTAVTDVYGTVVYSDDFHDPKSGWTTSTKTSGVSYAYTSDGYLVSTIGDTDFWTYAPYQPRGQQISLSVTGKQSSGAPVGTGFGVRCGTLTSAGDPAIEYEFMYGADETWYIAQRVGRGTGTRLQKGPAPPFPASGIVSVEGVCATLPGSHTTRLVLFVDRKLVADLTDTVDTLPDTGWRSALIVASNATTLTTVTVTDFRERDLSQ